MKPFGYWRDPACWMGCLLYALNRWLLKPRIHSTFLHSHFNDVLLIPCALPLLLLLQRWLRLRTHDLPPTPGEIVGNLAVWSVLFEFIGPKIMKTVGDPYDVLAYAAGAVVAGVWWQRARWRKGAP